VVLALAVLALLAGGCTKKEPVAAPSPSASPSPSPSPSPAPPPIAALTGIELPEAIERPVLAVKIDNASAALPPDGIEEADIVFEEEVEGGITRFLALFHSKDPKEVGPVRSGRESDADLLPQFQPVLGISGAARPVEKLFRDAGIRFFQEGEKEAKAAFYRVTDRVAPHNLFAHTDDLWATGDDLPHPTEPVFEFDEDAPSGGEETASVAMTYSNFANAQWTWDDKAEQWERDQNNSPHATAAGRTISAKNVVIMRVISRPGGRKDSAGNPTVELGVIGKGNAVFLRDGEAYKGRWRKESAEEPLEWLDRDGDPFPLQLGQTWIEVLPVDDDFSTEKAGASEAASED
jgi:hypothetical protein